jgi:hypothetical protein
LAVDEHTAAKAHFLQVCERYAVELGIIKFNISFN